MNDKSSLSWLERARRVRDGEPELAKEPAAVSQTDLQNFVEAILRRAVDSVVLCTRGGMYLEVSDSFCTLTGYSREELLGQTSITLGLVDPNGVRRQATSDVHRRIEASYENTIIRKDGGERNVEFSHQFLDSDYTLVIIRDVTSRATIPVAGPRGAH